MILGCDAGDPAHVNMELWDNDGPGPVLAGVSVPNCTGDDTLSLEQAHDYLLRVHWSQFANVDYSTWNLQICVPADC